MVGDQDVGRFDVPVDQAGFVRGIQRGRDLLDNRYRQRRFQRLAAVAEDRAEVATLDQPHVQVEAVVDLAEIVDRHNVRFVDARRGLRLAPEAMLEGDVLGQVRWQHLERDDAVGLGVVRPVNLAHSAPADQLLQLIVPEWCRIHRVTPRGLVRPLMCRLKLHQVCRKCPRVRQYVLGAGRALQCPRPGSASPARPSRRAGQGRRPSHPRFGGVVGGGDGAAPQLQQQLVSGGARQCGGGEGDTGVEVGRRSSVTISSGSPPARMVSMVRGPTRLFSSMA